jgi:hypothetical protein
MDGGMGWKLPGYVAHMLRECNCDFLKDHTGRKQLGSEILEKRKEKKE